MANQWCPRHPAWTYTRRLKALATIKKFFETIFHSTYPIDIVINNIIQGEISRHFPGNFSAIFHLMAAFFPPCFICRSYQPGEQLHSRCHFNDCDIRCCDYSRCQKSSCLKITTKHENNNQHRPGGLFLPGDGFSYCLQVKAWPGFHITSGLFTPHPDPRLSRGSGKY
jgi:hypothetical protein